MATIIKREGKKGVAYKIQVVVKDVGLGKMVPKCTTWKPTPGMTPKEIETACTIFASEFEKSVRESYLTIEDEKGNVNISFRELATKWIKRAEKQYGLSYVGLSEQRLEKIMPMIGGYKIKDITPSIVQATFDRIDAMRKTVYNIYPKPHIELILKRNNLDFAYLRTTELNVASISEVKNGRRIGLKFATMFADVCKMDVNRLFDISVSEEEYASTTRKGFKTVIYNVLAYAVRMCIIKDNYASAKYVDMGRKVQNPVDCMNEEELSKFYEALLKVDNIEWRVSVMTVLMTGIRRGELCGLNWTDIDFDSKTMHIQRSYSESPRHGLILKEPKTPKSVRNITMPDLLIEELRKYKEWFGQQKKLWGDRWIDSGSVFIQRSGERVNPANIKQWVSKTCKRAGIKHFSVHSLRHTNITLQIMSGVPIVTVSGRAGHSRTSTTTDTYAYYVQSADKSAAEAINNIFSGAKK